MARGLAQTTTATCCCSTTACQRRARRLSQAPWQTRRASPKARLAGLATSTRAASSLCSKKNQACSWGRWTGSATRCRPWSDEPQASWRSTRNILTLRSGVRDRAFVLKRGGAGAVSTRVCVHVCVCVCVCACARQKRCVRARARVFVYMCVGSVLAVVNNVPFPDAFRASSERQPAP